MKFRDPPIPLPFGEIVPDPGEPGVVGPPDEVSVFRSGRWLPPALPPLSVPAADSLSRNSIHRSLKDCESEERTYKRYQPLCWGVQLLVGSSTDLILAQPIIDRFALPTSCVALLTSSRP